MEAERASLARAGGRGPPPFGASGGRGGGSSRVPGAGLSRCSWSGAAAAEGPPARAALPVSQAVLSTTGEGAEPGRDDLGGVRARSDPAAATPGPRGLGASGAAPTAVPPPPRPPAAAGRKARGLLRPRYWPIAAMTAAVNSSPATFPISTAIGLAASWNAATSMSLNATLPCASSEISASRLASFSAP